MVDFEFVIMAGFGIQTDSKNHAWKWFFHVSDIYDHDYAIKRKFLNEFNSLIVWRADLAESTETA